MHMQNDSSSLAVSERLAKWQQRFPSLQDNTILGCQNLFFALARKELVNHRQIPHLTRMILGIHLLQKTMERMCTAGSEPRHVFVRWMPTKVIFPFVKCPVLGCLVGLNLQEDSERLEENNVRLLLQKHYPEYQLVPRSFYCHVLSDKGLRIVYFEIEKPDHSLFALAERAALKQSFVSHLAASIQTIVPSVFKHHNEEEVVKIVLHLSREIDAATDLPQVWMTMDHQTKHEIVFHAIIVYSSLQTTLPDLVNISNSDTATATVKRNITVKNIDGHPINACVLHIRLKRHLSLVRSDDALDFYAARHQVSLFIENLFGEFRDFNGGGLSKQRELLEQLKTRYRSLATAEVIETFFYNLVPLEKQLVLDFAILSSLFQRFLDVWHQKLDAALPYVFELHNQDHRLFLTLKLPLQWKACLVSLLEKPETMAADATYTLFEIAEGLFLNALVEDGVKGHQLIQHVQDALTSHHERSKNHKILRIGAERLPTSLDPLSDGSVAFTGLFLRLLFEGLTRFGKERQIENGGAEAISISSDGLEYTFKLREAYWNDGSPVTALDFEYAWKKTLSPGFETANAYLLYCIQHAQAAKEGRVPMDKIGIHALDEHTLRVNLAYPTPYFLELMTHPAFYPVHRLIDRSHPTWSYQTGSGYPCNGPFQLAINDVSQQTFRLVRNPFYGKIEEDFADEVAVTKVTPAQALQAFRRNELDWIGNPWGSWHPSFVPRNQECKVTTLNFAVCWLIFNTSAFPFNHPRIRRAFAYSINRFDLLSNSDDALAPAFSLLHPHQTFGPSVAFPNCDADHAQKQFTEALIDLEIAPQHFPQVSLIYNESIAQKTIMDRLEQQLRDTLGIGCTAQSVPPETLRQHCLNGDFQLCLIKWVPRFDNPIHTFNYFKYAQEKSNICNWEHDCFKLCLDRAQCSTPDKRREYLTQAEKLLSEEAPAIPLWFSSARSLLRYNFTNHIDAIFRVNGIHKDALVFSQPESSKEFDKNFDSLHK